MYVLIIPLLHGFVHQRNKFGAHRVIREALAKVDGFILNSQCAHHGKNSGAYMGEFAVDGW